MIRARLAAMALAAGMCVLPQTAAAQDPPPPPLPQVPLPGIPAAPTPAEQRFAEAKALFDTFEYEAAIAILDEVLTGMVGGTMESTPESMAEVLEWRGRAHFSMGNSDAARQDFASALSVLPEYRLAEDVSPRIVEVFEAVRTEAVGQVTISVTPPGDIDVDRRTYTIPADGATLNLTAGDHQLVVSRSGFAPVSQLLTVTAGAGRELALVLERVAANLEVRTTEPGVEVLVDGTSRGTTETTAGGAALLLNELPLGSHTLVLRRDCFIDAERTISLVADDLRTDPIALEPATAAVVLQGAPAGSTVFVDGETRGTVQELTLCQGEHLVEVRGPAGRFVDRRDWRAGATETLDIALRSAFPIVSVSGEGAETALQQLRTDVARVLGPSTQVLIYTPDEAALADAMRAENVPAGWLSDAVMGTAAALPPDVVRDMGRRLAARLGVQGFTAVVAGEERFQARVGLLAAGSGLPESITVATADQASVRAALDRLSAPLPPIMRPSLGASAVDVLGVDGAVVVRSSGPSADAGIAAGDVIVGIAGTPVASVSDLRRALSQAGATPVTLDVMAANGTSAPMSVTPVEAADILPLRDNSILYNNALLKLQERTQSAGSDDERASAHLSLAVVLLRLGSFDEALQSLGQARLGEGPGVSAGTVAYLRGLALEGVGRTADAQAAFAEAAAAPDARLGSEGPLVAPLARQRMGSGR